MLMDYITFNDLKPKQALLLFCLKGVEDTHSFLLKEYEKNPNGEKYQRAYSEYEKWVEIASMVVQTIFDYNKPLWDYLIKEGIISTDSEGTIKIEPRGYSIYGTRDSDKFKQKKNVQST